MLGKCLSESPMKVTYLEEKNAVNIFSNLKESSLERTDLYHVFAWWSIVAAVHNRRTFHNWSDVDVDWRWIRMKDDRRRSDMRRLPMIFEGMSNWDEISRVHNRWRRFPRHRLFVGKCADIARWHHWKERSSSFIFLASRTNQLDKDRIR